MTASLTFLPGVGFRQAGVRLGSETRVERDGRTLTVTQFVSTPDGTDLTYEITDGSQNASCVVPGPGPSLFDPDKVTLRDAEHDYAAAFLRSTGVIAGGVRRSLQAKPVPSTVRALELRVTSSLFGEWRVHLELVPFDADGVGRLQPVEASATHEGVTVHVRGISLTAEATAIRFEAVAEGSVERIIGVGGLHGMRAGATELLLLDEHGRACQEIAKRDAREPMDRSELAVFPALPDDARALELVVPFITIEETKAPVVMKLPVVDPLALTFGRYAIRVLSTGEAPDSPRRRNFGPALAVRLDLGGWQGDRRVLFPSGVLVDGNNLGMGYGNGINATAPQPAEMVEVRMPDPHAPKLLTLIAPVVQVRGPWRVRFSRPSEPS